MRSLLTYETKNADQLKTQLRDDYVNTRSFADRLRREFDYVWKKIDVHPFLVELENGKLPISKYKTYALQNYFYLIEEHRSASAAIARAHTSADVLLLRKWGKYFEPEFERYVGIMRAVGITEEELERVTMDPRIPLPAARAYVDFTYKTYCTGTMGELAACLLPCAWSYSIREVGGLGCAPRIAKGLGDHYGVDREVAFAYGNYASEKPNFLELISLKETISKETQEGSDELAVRIREIFRRCSEYEYIWWDLAYKHDPNKERELGSFF